MIPAASNWRKSSAYYFFLTLSAPLFDSIIRDGGAQSAAIRSFRAVDQFD